MKPKMPQYFTPAGELGSIFIPTMIPMNTKRQITRIYAVAGEAPIISNALTNGDRNPAIMNHFSIAFLFN
ncbi:MAG: hypothetical protein ABSG49_09205 [Methanoregula sp.]|jgi:hypothetical protein|uniref:hypothetical protein n=1 Tax=Methanoregula sp. TaxID=2052170 RepID=UPI003C2217F2